jgi:hypothetical protein
MVVLLQGISTLVLLKITGRGSPLLVYTLARSPGNVEIAGSNLGSGSAGPSRGAGIPRACAIGP